MSNGNGYTSANSFANGNGPGDNGWEPAQVQGAHWWLMI